MRKSSVGNTFIFLNLKIKRLFEARCELRIKKGGILTYNQEGTRTFEEAKIPLIPVWKWLLRAEAPF